VRVQEERLFSLPEEAPLIFGAAITDESAEWVGSWADGLLTVAKNPDELAKTVAAFRRGGGSGKPMRLQSAILFAGSTEIAQDEAFHHWGMACLDVSDIQDITMPEEFDRLVAKHKPKDICERLRISASCNRPRYP